MDTAFCVAGEKKKKHTRTHSLTPEASLTALENLTKNNILKACLATKMQLLQQLNHYLAKFFFSPFQK